jgi:hypothetical protein
MIANTANIEIPDGIRGVGCANDFNVGNPGNLGVVGNS